MAIIRFEQDASAPFGTGNFVDDQGRSTFAFDPETAARFSDTLPGQNVAELGGGGAAPPGEQFPGLSPEAASAQESLTAPAAPAGAPAPLAAPEAPGSPAVAAALGKLGQLGQGAVGGQQPGAAPPARRDNLQLAGRTVQRGLPAAQAGALAGQAEETFQARTELAGQARVGSEALAAQGAEALGALGVQQAEAGLEGQRESAETIESTRAESVALASIQDPEVDPGRLIGNMGTGRVILTAILAGIAGGLAREGAVNPVVGILNKSIDQDIRVQEQSIAAGRARRTGLIAQLREQGLDAKNSRNVAKTLYWNGIVNQTEAQREEAAKKDQTLQAFNETLQSATAERDKALANITAGAADTVTERFAPPRPTGAGQTPLQQLKLRKALAEDQERELERIGADEASQTVGRRLGVQELDKLKSQVERIGPKIDEADAIQNSLQQIIEATGSPDDPSTYDPETGKIVWAKDLTGAGFFGGKTFRPLGLGPAAGSQVLRELQESAVELRTTFVTGAVATPEQKETFLQESGGALDNEADFKRRLEANIRRTRDDGLRARSSLGKEGQRLYQANRDAARADRDTPVVR